MIKGSIPYAYIAIIRNSLPSCAFCEAACGIEVTADMATRRVTGVRGDKLDPFSKGFICAKAYALTALHDDVDRLRKPLRRRGEDFEEIGWDEAVGESADRLSAIQRKHGRDAVAYYFGNPTGHKGELLIYGGLLMQAVGSRQVYWRRRPRQQYMGAREPVLSDSDP